MINRQMRRGRLSHYLRIGPEHSLWAMGINDTTQSGYPVVAPPKS